MYILQWLHRPQFYMPASSVSELSAVSEKVVGDPLMKVFRHFLVMYNAYSQFIDEDCNSVSNDVPENGTLSAVVLSAVSNDEEEDDQTNVLSEFSYPSCEDVRLEQLITEVSINRIFSNFRK